MLSIQNLQMMARLIGTVPETRSLGTGPDDAATIDFAGLAAITGIVQAFLLQAEDQNPASVELALTVAIELLHELPKPSTSATFMTELYRRVGLREPGA